VRDFFSLDGAFSRYGTFVADTLILSFLWIFFSIPIFTIGAATSAMYYVSTRRIADREGYISSDFWAAFKANFKKATLFWLLILVVMSILAFNIWLMLGDFIAEGTLGGIMAIVLPAQFVIMLQITFVSIFIFPMTARFEMGFLQTLKSSFIMANRHFLTSITCTVLLVGLIIGGLYFIVILFAVPGIYAMLTSYMIMRIFKRYRPEIDKDPRLEIAEIEARKAEERRKRSTSDKE